MNDMEKLVGWMTRLGVAAFAGVFLSSASFAAQESLPVYLNKTASIDRRVDDLLKRMTLEEKVGQMLSDWPSGKKGDSRNPLAGGARQLTTYRGERTPRLLAEAVNEDQKSVIANSPNHIPALFHDECLHGAAMCPVATSFPQSIGLAATFSPELVGRVAAAIADEERSMGTRLVLAPVLNLSRDPRWGRTEETFGESSRLAADLGVAYVKEFQSRGIATAIKHFVANYGDGGVDSAAVFIEQSELRNYWLRPFEAAVRQGGSLSAMASYNSLNGLPTHSNSWLLTQVLRKEWGFQGIVVSDYNGWHVMGTHKVSSGDVGDKTVEELKACYSAGMEVPLHQSTGALPKVVAAVRKGEIPEALVNQVTRRMLKAKFMLGLFDQPFADPDAAEKTVHSQGHIALAQEAAAASLTLLKNGDGILPLDVNRFKRIGIAGPAADKALLGGYSRNNISSDVSPLKGFQKRFGAENVVFIKGNEEEMAKAAADCDVVLFFSIVREGEATDRSHFDIPGGEILSEKEEAENTGGAIIIDKKKQLSNVGNQIQAIQRLSKTGKPVILCLMAGSPVGLSPVIADVKAVLACWYPGEMGGLAIADVCAGDTNPGGKLPITWPKHAGQIPLYHDPYPFGRGGIRYGDDNGKPMFPFGFGLSYTQFEIKNLKADAKVRVGTPVRLSVDVTNTGKRQGAEVVQVYVHDVVASRVRPLKRLEAYQRVELKPGETRKVSFALSNDNLGFYDADGHWLVEPGDFEIMVGSSSEDLPLKTVVKLVGAGVK